jgi:hypothetical protein
MGREDQSASGFAVEGIRRKTDRQVQEGELLGLPQPLGFEVLLEPSDDLDDGARAASFEADQERAVIPTAADIFAPEPAVDQPAQIRLKVSHFSVVEPIETGRLHEADRVRASMTLSVGQARRKRRNGPRPREQSRLTAPELLTTKPCHSFGFTVHVNEPASSAI